MSEMFHIIGDGEEELGLYNALKTAATDARSAMTSWRRHLHMHPEVGFAEFETTEWLANRMQEWGVSYTRPTPTGLIADIEGARPGRTIAIRADIDALPIIEENRFDFVSTRPGTMHACGHDGHTASLLGLVQFFAQHRDFSGRLRFLFQPAEEVPPGGAQQMIAAGALEGVDACIGLHYMSEVATGKATITDGPMLANSDRFAAKILGRGGHGASPHQTIDAVMVGCHAVLNLQTIVSRKIDPAKSAVVSVGAIHSGTTFNVIADSAEIKGTVRSFDAGVRQQLADEIRRTLEATCDMYGASVELEYDFGYPACVNEPATTDVLRAAAAEVLGADAVLHQDPIMGGEDFAYYGQHVPASFIFVGCRSEAEGAVWAHHHPRFTIDEAALPLGMEILGRAALKLLEG